MDFRKLCNPINILLASNSPIKIAAIREAAEFVSTRINITPFDSGGSFNEFCNMPENPRGRQEIESCSKKRLQAMYDNSFADSLKCQRNKNSTNDNLSCDSTSTNLSVWLVPKPFAVISEESKTNKSFNFGGKHDYVFAIESGVIMPDSECKWAREVTYISYISSRNNLVFQDSLSYKEPYVSVQTTESFYYPDKITEILLNNPGFTSTQAVESFLGKKIDEKDPLFPIFGVSRKDIIKDKLVEIFKELGL